MALNNQFPVDNSGKLLIFDRKLWWFGVYFTHTVEPKFDHASHEVNLGCQTATFDAISTLYWKLFRERIKHALRLP